MLDCAFDEPKHIIIVNMPLLQWANAVKRDLAPLLNTALKNVFQISNQGGDYFSVDFLLLDCETVWSDLRASIV